MLAYFDYPAEHWKHLRTTNPIGSTFATVRLREGVTKEAGSRTAGLVMAFKQLQVTEGHWQCRDAAELVPLVRAGVCFEDGVQIIRGDLPPLLPRLAPSALPGSASPQETQQRPSLGCVTSRW